jgi:FMN phosphatase YigB (HAD superfamily)
MELTMDNRPYTIFCDLDGTLVKHTSPHGAQKPTHKMKLLPGVKEKLLEWDAKGYNIILVTGRKNSLRRITEEQLEEAGIFYDQLIMGIGGGIRYLINDTKPNNDKPTAVAKTVIRDKGIKDIEL